MKDVAGYVSLVVVALEAINKLVDSAAIDRAGDVLAAVKAICKSVQEARAGEVTPQMAKEQIDKLLAALKDNDAAVDAALREKFPT